MQTLSQMTLGDLLSYFRDTTITGFLIYVTWHGRGFLDEIRHFMKSTETQLGVIQTNHLKHIEESLATIAKAETKTADRNEYHGSGS